MRKNLVLLLGSLVFSFVVAEIICRIKGSYLSYNERTGAGSYFSPFEAGNRDSTHRYSPFEQEYIRRDEFTDSWTANEDGLKEKEARAIQPGKRILVLGDSYAEGVGAPPDSSYPRILESLFYKNGDTAIRVINAGIGGSDILYEYKLFLALLPKYKPDVIVVTVNGSDIDDCLIRGGFERFKEDGIIQYRNSPWFEPLYTHSLLVRLLVHDVFHYDFNFIRRENYEVAVAKAKENMAAAIDSFASVCAVRHFELHILFHPFYPDIQMPANYQMTGLIQHCKQKNISCTDCFECFTKRGINASNWQRIYWPSDGHFKPLGYELLAQCAFDMLMN
jgi:lysophospholipase L1-like esterase